jgi:hypothetical protein
MPLYCFGIGPSSSTLAPPLRQSRIFSATIAMGCPGLWKVCGARLLIAPGYSLTAQVLKPLESTVNVNEIGMQLLGVGSCYVVGIDIRYALCLILVPFATMLTPGTVCGSTSSGQSFSTTTRHAGRTLSYVRYFIDLRVCLGPLSRSCSFLMDPVAHVRNEGAWYQRPLTGLKLMFGLSPKSSDSTAIL